MLLVVYIIVGICIFLQAERGILDTVSFLRLFQNLNNEKNGPNSGKPVFILLPVLREQIRIEETVKELCEASRLNANAARVVVIATIREQADIEEGQGLTTMQVVENSMRSGLLQTFKSKIILLEEQNLQGNMASQLNYAVEHLLKNFSEDSLFLVYNSDSRVSQSTFRSLEVYSDKNAAFQQPCAYVAAMSPSSSSFQNALSLFQSWYCLGHESSLVQRYQQNSKRNLGIIVGHGSGMTLGLNKRMGGYPQDLLTEDLTFGFLLSAQSIPIKQMLALEVAGVPDNLSVFIKQGSVWFWNYLGYFSCYQKSLALEVSKIRLVLLLAKGISRGIYWFSSTLFIIIPIVIIIVHGWYLALFIPILSIVFFNIVPVFILHKKLPKLLHDQGFDEIADKVVKVSFSSILPSLIVIFLTDSLGTWIATARYFMFLITGNLPKKYKTGD